LPGISHDTSQAADAYDIQVTNNACLYRQNAVDDLYVGELLVPTNSRTYRISIAGNIFRSDYAQASNTSDVFIYNGTSITYKNNEHYRTGTTAATNTYIVELGHNSAIGTSADFDDVVLENNRFVVTGSNLSSARCIQIESDITTGTSVVRTAHNDFVGCPTTHYLVSASTNPSLVLDYGPNTKVGYYTPADTTPPSNTEWLLLILPTPARSPSRISTTVSKAKSCVSASTTPTPLSKTG
jgi:hypothetical protein